MSLVSFHRRAISSMKERPVFMPPQLLRASVQYQAGPGFNNFYSPSAFQAVTTAYSRLRPLVYTVLPATQPQPMQPAGGIGLSGPLNGYNQLVRVQWNAAGIRRRSKFKNVLSFQRVDVACIQETYLKEGQLYSVRDFTIYRRQWRSNVLNNGCFQTSP
jgi:hypothetical protein